MTAASAGSTRLRERLSGQIKLPAAMRPTSWQDTDDSAQSVCIVLDDLPGVRGCRVGLGHPVEKVNPTDCAVATHQKYSPKNGTLTLGVKRVSEWWSNNELHGEYEPLVQLIGVPPTNPDLAFELVVLPEEDAGGWVRSKLLEAAGVGNQRCSVEGVVANVTPGPTLAPAVVSLAQLLDLLATDPADRKVLLGARGVILTPAVLVSLASAIFRCGAPESLVDPELLALAIGSSVRPVPPPAEPHRRAMLTAKMAHEADVTEDQADRWAAAVGTRFWVLTDDDDSASRLRDAGNRLVDDPPEVHEFRRVPVTPSIPIWAETA